MEGEFETAAAPSPTPGEAVVQVLSRRAQLVFFKKACAFFWQSAGVDPAVAFPVMLLVELVIVAAAASSSRVGYCEVSGGKVQEEEKSGELEEEIAALATSAMAWSV